MKIEVNAHLGFHKDGICFELKCERSNTRIARVNFNAEESLKLMANYGHVKGIAETGDLTKVGKFYESKHFSFPLPDKFETWTCKRSEEFHDYMRSICPEGWEISTYLGSQGSFVFDGKGNTTVNTYIFRFVDEDPENNGG